MKELFVIGFKQNGKANWALAGTGVGFIIVYISLSTIYVC